MIVGHIGCGAEDQGYDVEKSLRTRGNSGNRLTHTFGSRTSGTTGTLSMLIERGKLGVVQYLLGGSNYEVIRFDAADKLFISGPGGTPYWTSTRQFRDPSAHMHIHIAWDTTQAVAANRCRVWVNLEEITEWSSKPDITQNAEFIVWNTPGIVCSLLGSVYFDQNFDGLASEIHWLDGQYLPPTDFAELDANGVCVPKKYTGGNYGNNGFYLDFKDGTSLTTLGYDKSGNGNHWTLNGYSLTAGATYDWMDDTPTNNYAVLNPLDKASTVVPSAGNLQATYSSSGSKIYSTIPLPLSGKYYCEFYSSTATNASIGIGFGVANPSVSPASAFNAANTYTFYTSAAPYLINSGTLVGPISGYTNTAGVPFKLAVDVDSGKVWLGQGTIWWDSSGGTTGNPETGANPTFAIACGGFKPFVHFNGGTITWYANFGQRPFQATQPAGFKALCTKNLPLGGSITTSGSFTGNANADGPFVWLNGDPVSMTINGNAVTWGTHADRTAGGFKVRTSSASYNASGTNNYVVTITGNLFGDEIYAPNTAKGNP